MREKYQDQFGNDWRFIKWRIEPPGYKLPTGKMLPPEGIWENQKGHKIGMSPDAPWLKDYQESE